MPFSLPPQFRHLRSLRALPQAPRVAVACLLTGTVAILLGLPITLAQIDSSAPAPIGYITRYLVDAPKRSTEAVYGVFDMGSKPSVRITTESTAGGELTLNLHGKHYRSPSLNTFYVKALYEDVSGRGFDESDWVAFEPMKQDNDPTWFTRLNGISGLFGEQTIRIRVPYGTSVINLVGRAKSAEDNAPNTLLGYVSQIQAP